MSASNERILVTVEGGVADVRLNRPDKMNALDQAMFDALIETGEQLARLPDLRAVVLSGAGRAFCAGLDMGRMAGMLSDDAGASQHDSIGAGRLGQRTHGLSNRPQYACMVWRELPVPVFAAVHGVAFGGGLQVALGADVRYVAPDARLSVMELKWGLVPDMAGMVLTRGLVRPDVLRELIYSARVLSGSEACALGLGTCLADDPRAAALAAAREVAQKNPDAIRAAKRLMAVAEYGDAAAILQAESDEQDRLVGSPNQREAVLANLEKRAPRFEPGG
ncbi:crotonase/enoyl-CoA hydratase family protein [Cupriavidus taiwanensis]|uniref:crotonase/enoyl-CoA hydratase family protein n=1 Tax=Cupriavidus taiwanensis TaxID=164546 RepID=UPI000E106F4B|nr:crotonase/enoyl-CoA hydratase family protein [Cupriavidus taiwanensis]SOY52665.1 putative Enoyl-CoA hydratase/isomerase [Cupriavidus taiwanensis]SOY52826.1 putative Enoyl-CoA hydratase/isomerase [Cupriavidus taiwanensis]SOY85712.1 putative Enoyl-CoA hydratase/isomerase [Cupriavidus taiwanensis]SOZ60305.1 putative Enoyl-CoA hydratase/isomerase [Cupriavidus taiwanensis]SOZ80552.1 putative Enoyl-CoA hydratase/isomerase [Cupriavidus taiwanensis]